MNQQVLSREVQEFIRQNLHADTAALLLKGSPFPEVTASEIVQQIEALKRAEKKLPTWTRTPGIYFPKQVSIEQTSSELTAAYKVNLVSGNVMVDITGGLGVDDFYFAKRFNKVVHCEMNEELSAIAQHNFEVLKADNVICFQGDGLDHLKSSADLDLIYADPARRGGADNKVFLLSDCTPDITAHLDFLFEKSPLIMLKTSPMLDLNAGLRELKQVAAIHIVAVNNEVKELLWLMQKNTNNDEVGVTAVNLRSSGKAQQRFEFKLSERYADTAPLGELSGYLYEPNAAIMKSGAFDLVALRFPLKKLHRQTHLYTSDHLIQFPGRRFKVVEVSAYQKKQVKQLLGGSVCNIITRNFPESVAQLRKKFKIREGGERYAIFTTTADNSKKVILAERISEEA